MKTNIKKLETNHKYYDNIDWLLESSFVAKQIALMEDGIPYEQKNISINDLYIDEDLNVYPVSVYNYYDIKFEKYSDSGLYEKTNKTEIIVNEVPLFTKIDIAKAIIEDYNENKDYYANNQDMKAKVAESEMYLSELSNRD